jgi:hypothetical protein
MVGAVEVLGGVPAGRRVAAAHVAAGKAQPQMDPAAAGLEAFLATLGGTRLYVLDLGDMSAA